jgi:hypothetical protein
MKSNVSKLNACLQNLIIMVVLEHSMNAVNMTTTWNLEMAQSKPAVKCFLLGYMRLLLILLV